MKWLSCIALCLTTGLAAAATAPFIQITGAPSLLANTCSSKGATPVIPVAIEVPAGMSYRYDLGFAVPGYFIDYYGELTYIAPSVAPLQMLALENGPAVDALAPLPIGAAATWYGATAGVTDQTELVLTLTAYSGPNGTGNAVSVATLNWNCTTGEIVSIKNAGNAEGPVPASLTKVLVVEFYNATLNHYFISASAAEIAALDSGQTKGWVRTGKVFNVLLAPATGSSPVCRLYIPPALGDSHFYSASPAECAAVQAQFPGFSFESPAVFYVDLPNAVTGACPAFTTPVYRLWNNRADSNHRYTTDPALKAQMIGLGYVPEGYGPDAVIMCSPV